MKVSIITAVYNNRESVLDAIQSVQNQSYSNIEHILIDGGSTDGTKELIDSLEQKPSVFISEPDKGIYDALNKGIRCSTGDIIGFMHSDDIFPSRDIINTIVDVFKQNNVDTVYGDLQYVSKSDSNKIIRYWKSNSFNYSDLKYGWMPPHPTVYLKSEVYKKNGMFDTSFKIAADYDFMLRIFSDKARRSTYLPKVIVKMRVGGESNSIFNYIKKWKEDYRALRSNNVGGIITLVVKNFRKLIQFIK